MSERTREDALLTGRRELIEGFFEMRLRAPRIAARTQPGQFVFLRVGKTTAPLLRRPVSICGVDAARGEITLLYKVVGAGTALMAQLPAGQVVDCMGPIGAPFPLEAGARPLVIAGGMGIAPLALLVERLDEGGARPALYYGVEDRAHAFLLEGLRAHSDLALVPRNEMGLVTERLPRGAGYTMAYACGPLPMLKAAAAWAAREGLPGYVSLEERMGCGIGACSGCAFPLKDGKGGVTYKKVCVDGPVFPMGEVIFDG